LLDVMAEDFDAGRVSQIEAVNVQPVLPLVEIGFAGITERGIDRKARGGDDACSGAKHHERGLIADLEPRAGDQRDLSLERSGLKAFLIIQPRAGEA